MRTIMASERWLTATSHITSLLSILSNVQTTSLLSKVAKWTIYTLLLLNIRSFPLVWHVRVFDCLIKMRLSYLWLRCKTLLSSRRNKERALEGWLDSRSPLGKKPFEVSEIYKSFASIDESDFNSHLSNSSYAKTLDRCRFDAAFSWFIQYFRVGGIMPLAGTHFSYIREIPILARYEVRTSIGAWDDKWIYLICRFVSPKKEGKKGKKVIKESVTPRQDPNSLFHASISTPSQDISNAVTPLQIATPMIDGQSDDAMKDLKAITSKLIPSEEADGAVLHTVTISQLCFKIGRITVPPALVIASNGFSLEGGNPPAHWDKVRAVAYNLHGGSLKSMRDFYKGGWRTVPESDRWWNEALGGAIEEQRKTRLEGLAHLRRGMESARAMV